MSKDPKNKKKTTGASLPPWMPDNMRSQAPAKAKDKPGRPAKAAAGKPARRGKPAKDAAPGQPGKPGRRSQGAAAPSEAGKARRPGKGDRGRKPLAVAPGSGKDPMAAREAAKYDNPIASREAIAALLIDSDGPLTAEEIGEALELLAEDRFDALSRRLAAMVRDGQLLRNRRGGYAVAQQLDLVAGTVIANPDGFGFLKCDDGGEDLFLPPGELRKALHGDRVLASITGVDRRGRREGAIVEVLEHRLTRLTGRYSERARIGMVVPDDRRVLTEVLIPPEENNGAREGQLVVVEVTQPPEKGRPPMGRILLVLGDRLTPS
ncbi:MAG TPA: ribonuclease R, partial [Arenimonas sp.]|nr:ribonuclease R [Arenimonas sp.]